MTATTEATAGLRPLAELPLEGRRVFVRADLDDSAGLGEERLRLALPTLEAVRARGARLVVGSSLARPSARPNEHQIEPIAARLAELLGADVLVPDECAGDAARKIVQELRPGQICVLENLGSEPDEASDDRAFAERLAALADVYVNDALAACREPSASVTGLPRLMRERGMGLRLERELTELQAIRTPAARPFVALVGGEATRERIALLDALLTRADELVIGGALGMTLLAARGTAVGRTRIGAELLAEARSFLARARDRKLTVRLPEDVVVTDAEQAEIGLEKQVSALRANAVALDLGAATIARFSESLTRARTVLWLGSLAPGEHPAFEGANLAIGRKLVSSKATRVVLDGPQLRAFTRGEEDLLSNIGFVSTGGRASLEYIAGRLLPGIEALRSGAT